MSDKHDDDQFDTSAVTPPQPDFGETLQALRDYENKDTGTTAIYGLSGITQDQLAEVKPLWEALKPVSRRKIMREIATKSEVDFMLEYSIFGNFGLDDADSGVREAAIDTLWFDNSLTLMNRLIKMAENDTDIDVRASALNEVGRFILMGELEDIPQEDTLPAQELAVRIWNDYNQLDDVRRRALEAISRCSHKIVTEAITEAYNSSSQPLRVSALFAMGYTYNERWASTVLKEIESADPEIRYEATRAAGSLELMEAVPALARLSVEGDREIELMAIWSLGEIGGKEVMRILAELAEQAEESEDDDLLEAVDDAVINATLTSDLGL
jgi:hypothetical protein